MSLLAAAAIAIACIIVAAPRLLGRAWPESITSFGAGVSIAYVVLHLLPAIGFAALGFDLDFGDVELNPTTVVYALVLTGILATLVLRAAEQGTHGFQARPRLAIARPLASALMLGYLLADKSDAEIEPVIVFAIAIGIHVAFGTHRLALGLQSRSIGPIVAVTIVGGYAIGLVPILSEPLPTDLVTALLAGGVMTTTIHEVLSRQRRFAPLFAGAIAEGVLLAILLG